eukprot:6179102-Pleurochrysis_carterae.AAC.3
MAREVSALACVRQVAVVHVRKDTSTSHELDKGCKRSRGANIRHQKELESTETAASASTAHRSNQKELRAKFYVPRSTFAATNHRLSRPLAMTSHAQNSARVHATFHARRSLGMCTAVHGTGVLGSFGARALWVCPRAFATWRMPCAPRGASSEAACVHQA